MVLVLKICVHKAKNYPHQKAKGCSLMRKLLESVSFSILGSEPDYCFRKWLVMERGNVLNALETVHDPTIAQW